MSRSPLLTLTLYIVCCSSCSDEEPGGDEGTSCETSWAIEEGGDDYGEPWDLPTIPPDMEVPKFDFGGGTLELSLEEASYADGELVEDWTFESSTGAYFRMVTLSEAERNGWSLDDRLIVAPEFASALETSSRFVRIVLPIGQSLLDIDFLYRGDTPPVQILRRGSAHVDRPRSSRFPYYTSAELPAGSYVLGEDELVARLAASEDGHASLDGQFGSFRFSLRGKVSSSRLDLPAPVDVADAPIYHLRVSGDAASVVSLVLPPQSSSETADIIVVGDSEQCTDSFDNDGSGEGDSCDFECMEHTDYAGPPGVIPLRVFEHTKSFSIFGDLLYCSQAGPGAWEVDLSVIGMEAAQLLNWLNSGTPDNNPPFRLVNIGCDVTSPEIASACHSFGGCGEYDDYPLEFLNDYNDYIEFVWALVDWYVDGREAVPSHAAVIATEHGSAGAKGLAYFEFFPEDEPGLRKQGGAISDVTAGAPGYNVAHELGHTMGLPHDLGRFPEEGPLVSSGLMRDGGGSVPVLGAFDPSEGTWWGIVEFPQLALTPPAVWAQYVQSKSWPRPSGFGYTGEAAP